MREVWIPLVPTLCLGMPSRTLRVPGPRPSGPSPPRPPALPHTCDAERRKRHSHAERGNEGQGPPGVRTRGRVSTSRLPGPGLAPGLALGRPLHAAVGEVPDADEVVVA